MLGKVANLIQQNYSNLKSVLGIQNTGSSATKNLNPINAPNFNSQQVTAAAAKILNKSPLEADFDASDEHLKQNPYQYGVVYYPSNIPELGAGHYMMFDIYLNNKSKPFTNKNTGSTLLNVSEGTAFTVGKLQTSQLLANAAGENLNKLTSQFQSRNALGYSSLPRSTGIQSAHNTHTFVSDTIILYTPPQVKTAYGTAYDTPETGQIGQRLQSSTGFFDSIASSAYMGLREFTLGVVGGLPGAGVAAGALVKRNAEARNPNLEVVFKSVPFRKFEYTFEFAPRNKIEVESVNKILKLFRYHMQPGLQGGSSSFFDVPSEFQLTYMYIDKQNSYIPKISRCVLENMEIDQSPEGVFTTFRSDEKGAFPTLTTMKLSFTETEIMTKQKVADGF